MAVLVGNKADRDEDREVEWSEASRWAADNGEHFLRSTLPHNEILISIGADVHYIESSSLTGENVEAPFALAARSVLLSIESGMLDPEKPGSGVSYGDRSLRRVSSSSRLSVTLGISSGDGRKKGLFGRGGKCC